MRILMLCVCLAGFGARLFAAEWPQFMGPQRDGVWRDKGILESFPAGGPKIRWRVPVGLGYAGPAVANGKVILADRQLAQGANNPQNQFARDVVKGTERLVCLNEADGKQLWVHEYEAAYDISYPAGPRTTPVIADGKVYALGAVGDLRCLNLADGSLIWSKNFKKDIGVDAPMWGYSSSPLIDGNKLICLARGVNTTVIAYDKESGKEIWKALTAAEPGYCPPVIYDIAGIRTLVIWHPESINGLDPESGKTLWSYPFAVRAGLTAPMPRAIQQADGGTLLFVTSFYNGPVMLKFAKGAAKPELLWKGKAGNEKNTDILHSIIPTPFVDGDYIYGVCSYGQLRCIEIATGKRVWESFVATGGPYPKEEGERWANAFLIKNGDRFFLPNEKGDLIIAKLSPKGYEEISRAHILEPTGRAIARPVVWSHPAFANKAMFARNDKEIVCVELSKE